MPVSAGDRLVDLLTAGRAESYHAKYAVRSDDPEIGGGTFTLETWRQPGKVRQDAFSQAGGQKTTTSAYRLDDTGYVVSCEQFDAEPWTCRRIKPAPGEFDGLLDEVRRQVKGNRVVQRTARAGGRTSQCFDIEAVDAKTTICVTPQGVPTLVQTGAARLELLDLDASVKPADFVPPATVSG